MSKMRFTFLSIIVDAVIVNMTIWLAFLIRFRGDIPTFNFSSYLNIWWVLTLVYLASGWIYGLYEPEQIDTPWGTTRAVVSSMTFGAVVVAAVAFFGGTATVTFARWTLILSWLFNVAFLIGWRIVFLRAFSIRWPVQRTMILGTNAVALDLARSITERSKWGWQFIGFIALDGCSQESLAQELKRRKINRLLVAEPVDIREILETITLNNDIRVTIDVVPEMYEIFFGEIDSIVGDIPLMRLVSAQRPRYERWLKRAIDIVGAFIVAVVTSPAWILSALAIVIESGRPVFYKQTRVGLKQNDFIIYKLRTMRKDAESISGPVLASEEDPRITRVGRFLRRYRIDELPQIINILEGTMSFIGPRPERPVFVAEYIEMIPGYAERFNIKPGVTGLAQINGGYATTPRRKLKYDLIYLYHQSVSMDIQVVVETLKVVLTGRGAR